MQKTSPASSTIGKRVLTVLGVVALGLALASCDKCGNSIFKVDSGMLACKDERPRS